MGIGDKNINENLKKIKEYEIHINVKINKLNIKYRFSFQIKKSSKIFFRIKRKTNSTFKKY